MAKRRKKKLRRVQRRNQYIRRRSNVLESPKIWKDLRYAQDRRQFRSRWDEGYRKVDGTPVAYKATSTHKKSNRIVNFGLSRIRFADPRRVVVCKRRGQRRRALFAKKIIGRGKGSGNFKRRIIREVSKVRC